MGCATVCLIDSFAGYGAGCGLPSMSGGDNGTVAGGRSPYFAVGALPIGGASHAGSTVDPLVVLDRGRVDPGDSLAVAAPVWAGPSSRQPLSRRRGRAHDAAAAIAGGAGVRCDARVAVWTEEGDDAAEGEAAVPSGWIPAAV